MTNLPRRTWLLLVGLGTTSCAAATEAVDGLAMSLSMFGGLALFLFGLEQLTSSLRGIAGNRMRHLLGRLTSNRVAGATAGALMTAIIQSSSVTTVLTVGFVSAGLMSLSQSVGVIMGANVGTTITAQVIAFKVTKAALPIAGIGFCFSFFGRRERIRQLGHAVFGLGLLFLGMNVMSEAMQPLRSYPPFLDLMTKMSNPLLGIAVAAAFTGLVQSSSATTGIVIAAASQGLLSLPAGIALTLGANVGTCVTAGFAAIGKPKEAQRVALVHVLFNVIGVLLWVAFIDQLAELAMLTAPAHAELPPAARLAAETPRQIANAHTLFNVCNTIVLLPFGGLLARAAERLVRDAPLRDERERTAALPLVLLNTPPLALDAVRAELVRVGELVAQMLKPALTAVVDGDHDALDEIHQADALVDEMHSGVVVYLGRLSTHTLTYEDSRELALLLSVANNL